MPVLNITKSNIQIKDSAFIRKKFFQPVLDYAHMEYPYCEALQRSDLSLKMEWATHNFLYRLNIKRERTKDVDLNYPCDKPEWLYIVCGCLCWIFIK